MFAIVSYELGLYAFFMSVLRFKDAGRKAKAFETKHDVLELVDLLEVGVLELRSRFFDSFTYECPY